MNDVRREIVWLMDLSKVERSGYLLFQGVMGIQSRHNEEKHYKNFCLKSWSQADIRVRGLSNMKQGSLSCHRDVSMKAPVDGSVFHSEDCSQI